MPGRLRYATAILLFTLAASGCSGGSGGEEADLPDGADTLTSSAEAMAELSTARFDLEVEGTVGDSSVRAASIQVTREGDAAGTVSLDEGGQVTESEVVFVGGTLYLKGPTGGFQQVPAALAADIYDPTVLLDPDNGVAALLRSGTDAVTEAREEVEGVDAYRIKATFAGAEVAGLIPGLEADTSGVIWVGVEDNRVVQARFTLPDGEATVRLSDFDEAAEITAPE